MSDAMWCPSCKEPSAERRGGRITCPCGYGRVMSLLRRFLCF